MRIILKQERKAYVLDQLIPEEPVPNGPKAQRDPYTKHKDDSVDVGCVGNYALGANHSTLSIIV